MARKPFNINQLHPKARDVFGLLAHRLEEGWKDGHTVSWFRPFEGYRSPEDQIALVAKNTSKAGPWQSGHNYGLCVDFVAFDPETNRWSWDPNEDWEYLQRAAMGAGLISRLKWDRPHVEHPIWLQIERHLI